MSYLTQGLWCWLRAQWKLWHALIFWAMTTVTCENDATPTRFGFSGTTRPIQTMEGYPLPKHFFEDYVIASQPLKMTHAAINSLAYQQWDDEFFLALDIPDDDVVNVETKKKEDRSQPPVDMHFQDFVEKYNETEQYMVNPVPEYLGEYVPLPGPLHCPGVYEDLLVENIMWFSSGGTKSVVHTDSVENIICLFRGDKQFILVDPRQYADKVELDHPEGAYSSIDVDNVDFERYPGLKDVEYYHANLSAGDCMYIPFKWIHQVRSYGRNIAVNVWWDHYGSRKIDLSTCPEDFDHTLTFDAVEFQSFAHYMNQPEALRDQFHEFSLSKDLHLEKFIDLILGNDPPDLSQAGVGYQLPLKKIFRIIDVNRDGLLHPNEILAVEDEDWEQIQMSMMQFEAVMTSIEERLFREQELEEQEEERFREEL